jgi:hypothetical protein
MKTFFLFVVFALSMNYAAAQGVVYTNFPKQTLYPKELPAKQNVWAFLMAGQSNMAGRGDVEPADTIPHPRILTINQNNEIVIAKEPLHFYEPTRTGLDCGLSFARTLLKSVPDNVSILLVPTAVGGSSIQQWLGDSVWRDVHLLMNAKHRASKASEVSVFKGILWHQGESNSNTGLDIEKHAGRLTSLAVLLRDFTGDKNLPFLIGELGSFSRDPKPFEALNRQLRAYSKTDKNSAVIETNDLPHNGDNLHFNSEAQRKVGERFAQTFVLKFMRR